MGLLDQNDLISLDYSYLGEPFLFVAADPDIDLLSMDYSYLGEPFVSNWVTGTATNKIKKIHTSPWSKIKNIFGKSISGIKTIASTPTE